MQPSFICRRPASLAELGAGQQGVLDRIELPEEISRRLMELGFVPGGRVTASLRAPGGDPLIFRVDGSEIALRRDTAFHLKLRLESGDN
jgi:ferrous iron transport protein A